MPEDTPERLKAFRAQYDQPKGLSDRLAVVQLAILLAGFSGLFALYWQGSNGERAAGNGVSAESHRELAVYLVEKNQPLAAMEAYEEYLDRAELDPPSRAKVCYSMGKLAIEAGQYDRALTYLYESEFLERDSDLAGDINKKVVLCLEKLGRTATLRRALKERSRLNAPAAEAPAGEVVVAEFSGGVMTERDLERELDKLPASARATFDSADKKAEFLKNHITERLLLDKARRLELDKDPEIVQMVAGQMDTLIVQKLIADEVGAKVHITEPDVERYYRAEIERFAQPSTASGFVAGGNSEADALDAASAESGERVTLHSGRMAGGSIPHDAAGVLAKAILRSKPGDVSTAVHVATGWYAFKGVLTPGRPEPFEKVRDRATRLYEEQKEQEQLAHFIQETLEAHQVKIYRHRLGNGDGGP